MKVEDLDLSPVAHKAAVLLAKAHPGVVFTSGRRDLGGQARAMASNVVHSRDWIRATYVATAPTVALQGWVDAHPHTVLLVDIAAGLLGVLKGFSGPELAHVSAHLSGMAFDVQPVSGPAGDAIKATIRTLPGLTKFLDHEGGLVRWHLQFS